MATNRPYIGMLQSMTPTGNVDSPTDWTSKKKLSVLVIMLLPTLNFVLGPSLPASLLPALETYFAVTERTSLLLALSMYQFGFVLGSLLLANVSEFSGRKNMFFITVSIYGTINVGNAFVRDWMAFIWCRLISGISASAAANVTVDICADLWINEKGRGRAFAVYSLITTVAPQFSPLATGWAADVDWRWPFWVSGIASGASLFLVLFMPETYYPHILQKQLRNEEKADSTLPAGQRFSAFDRMRKRLFVSAAKPLWMIGTEPMLSLTCLYLGFINGILYLFFEAYPRIFHGLSARISGLTYLPIVFGLLVGFALFLLYEHILHAAQAREATWALNRRNHRLPLGLIGSLLLPLSLLVLSLTSTHTDPTSTKSYILPLSAGIPFGIAYFFIITSLTNYLADAFPLHASSVLAAINVARSLGAGVLPFAADPMHSALGLRGGMAVLAGVSVGVMIVPVMFWRCGGRIKRWGRAVV